MQYERSIITTLALIVSCYTLHYKSSVDSFSYVGVATNRRESSIRKPSYHNNNNDVFVSMSYSTNKSPLSVSNKNNHSITTTRRNVLLASSLFGGIFGGGGFANASANNVKPTAPGSKGPTNEVIRTVSGIKHRRLGGSDIIVSEVGLGTQRWVSSDYNAPDEDTVFKFMDRAILESGVNLIDTAEQYPIPSDDTNTQEGDTERVIGRWMKDRKVARDKVVIATKITGGRNVTPKNIKEDCEGSLKRLGTDYIDIYQLHWPQRYSPQSNWGQSLAYNIDNDSNSYWRGSGGPTSFEDLCLSMEKLIQDGKIRSWGLCNDNAYGLTACTRTAKSLGTTPPCSIQGDYSMLDRKCDENGVSEAASPYNENIGFMSYNALAGGMLTGKYMNIPAAIDDLGVGNRERATETLRNPRGRMDTRGWGITLYRYRTESAQAAIKEYDRIAKKYKMTLTELALRWNKQRNLVTTTLVGHSNIKQLDETIKYFSIKEPLSNEMLWEIDMVHMKNRLPLFSSDHVGRDWYGTGEIGETIP